jgi:uncharacterized protein YkwD
LKRLRRLLIFLLLLSLVWFIYGKDLKESNVGSVLGNIKTDVNLILNHPKIVSALDTIKVDIDQLFEELKQKEQPDQLPIQEEKTELEAPLSHTMSVYNIELGDLRSDVEQKVGKPQRSSYNEYGVNWYTYHENYHHFIMVAYNDEGKVAGLYTNQNLISSKQGLSMESTKEAVIKELGEPVSKIQKGWVNYEIGNNDEFNMFQIDNSYITVFYDKHENNTVTAVQIISDELEKQKQDYYPEVSQQLKEGFEFQLFDLTNAARVEHGLPVLTWDDRVKMTARDHSADMAKNHYFNHTNLEGLSPFDRMEEDHITFHAAGENLAAGQLSSIFAHEGLMNSLGHRENILQNQFEALGVGVAFDSESKPYFTENFLAK